MRVLFYCRLREEEAENAYHKLTEQLRGEREWRQKVCCGVHDLHAISTSFEYPFSQTCHDEMRWNDTISHQAKLMHMHVLMYDWWYQLVCAVSDVYPFFFFFFLLPAVASRCGKVGAATQGGTRTSTSTRTWATEKGMNDYLFLFVQIYFYT